MRGCSKAWADLSVINLIFEIALQLHKGLMSEPLVFHSMKEIKSIKWQIGIWDDGWLHHALDLPRRRWPET